MSLHVQDDLFIEEREIEITYILASGPGGQNVNKLATAAQLRFDARRSASLSDRISIRLQKLAGSRLTKDGIIVITAQSHRSQARNRDDAIERLIALIREAASIPRRRIATRPSLGQRRKRLEGKAHRAGIKQGRNGGVDLG